MADSTYRMPTWYGSWLADLRTNGPLMNDRQLESAADLTAVLLCGEQSAIRIFAEEVRRGRQRGGEQAIAELAIIEADEHVHERALLAFANWLPRTAQQHSLKRNAQRFFAGLGRCPDLPAHFWRISHLDSAVCRIMSHLENGSMNRRAALARLANQIKMDEARHVAVTRRYARARGVDRRSLCTDAEQIRLQLVDMLWPLGGAFEAVGVDSDRLFRHLKKGGHE